MTGETNLLQNAAYEDAGHKDMLISLLESCGEEKMNENEILSLLLSFSLKKTDCVEAANFLLNRFGSFSNVFDASADTLTQVPFINMDTALLIKSVPELVRRVLHEGLPKGFRLESPGDAEKYLYPELLGLNMETAIALITDKNKAPVKTVRLGSGLSQSVELNTGVLIREALMANASYIVLAHSHPGGRAKPSKEDIVATVSIANELSAYGIKLLDHLIFSKNECFYMSDDKALGKTILGFSKYE
ncbi:MAG: Mov34/MPN/PAD-1 family protein [Clostridia bacterium]|nr:Mov34/MPN/PAD-1 family protein [Clostridia bacterium]